MNSLLKNILMSITYGLPLTDIQDIFKTFNLPSFDALFIETVVVKHFRLPDFKHEVKSARPVRNQPRFSVPRSRTSYGMARRSVYVPKLFNDLPQEVLAAQSKQQLKKALLTSC